MILLIGSTGRVGTEAARALRAQGTPVRALVRSREKGAGLAALGCELAVGDALDRASLDRAMEGVTGVAACLGTPRGPRTTAADYLRLGIEGNRNVFAAAQATGHAPRVVFLSSLNIERAAYFPDFAAKVQAEASLKASGLPYTILRPSGFMEGLLQDVVHGSVAQLAGSFPHPINLIAVADVGAAVARAFDRADLVGKTVELFGPEKTGFVEAIEKWSAYAGKKLTYRRMPLGLFRVIATLGAPFQPILPSAYQVVRSLNECDWSGDPRALRDLLGREPTTLRDIAHASA